ncbi:hypothetical protein ACQ4PT_054446 [Festuca glaucescens]
MATANPATTAVKAARETDGPATRARLTKPEGGSHGGLLEGLDFRHHLRKIARKVATQPNPSGVLVGKGNDPGRFYPEFEYFRQKAKEFLNEEWRKNEDAPQVISDPREISDPVVVDLEKGQKSKKIGSSVSLLYEIPLMEKEINSMDTGLIHGSSTEILHIIGTNKDWKGSANRKKDIKTVMSEELAEPVVGSKVESDRGPRYILDEGGGHLKSLRSGGSITYHDIVYQEIRKEAIQDRKEIIRTNQESISDKRDTQSRFHGLPKGNRELVYILRKGSGKHEHNHSQHHKHISPCDLMDKKMEIAAGKKQQGEGEQSSAGENITPIAREAGARTGAHQLAAASAVASEKKFMASTFVAGMGRKKMAMKIHDDKAPEDDEVLVVDFEVARKEIKTPWIMVGRYNTKRIFNTAGLFTRMRQVWQLQGGMTEKSIGEKKFLIVLEKEGDYKHILKGGPWLYQNDAFLVAKYDGVSSAQDVPINIMPIWVRVLDLPFSMMTKEWGEKIGKKFLGHVCEVGKDNHGHVWASFLRIRVEHDVEQPIKRWIPIAGKEGSKPKRYEVKYEGAPHFCFFCGIFGHNERTCMMPEEEKMVRYCEEQRASPFRQAENRSYYVPADEKKIKRSLHFSPASSGWKLTPKTDFLGNILTDKQQAMLPTDQKDGEEEIQGVPQLIQDVLAAAVTNLQVNDGPVIGITSAQVTKAAEEITKRVRWSRRNKQNKPKMATLEAAGGPKTMAVPSILDCLREDGSLYAELKGGAAKTASAFLKKKNKVLGKRSGSEDTSMDEGGQSFVLRFRGHGGKRNKVPDGSSQEVMQSVEEDKEAEEEATSHGAAGQLTGTEDRTCQEP